MNIVATVTETTGAAGMKADCVLLVDGVEADRIRALWVDAGDAVSCAFTEHFAREGTYGMEVRAEDARSMRRARARSAKGTGRSGNGSAGGGETRRYRTPQSLAAAGRASSSSRTRT